MPSPRAAGAGAVRPAGDATLDAEETAALAIDLGRLTVVGRTYAERALKAAERVVLLEDQAALASPTVVVH